MSRLPRSLSLHKLAELAIARNYPIKNAMNEICGDLAPKVPIVKGAFLAPFHLTLKECLVLNCGLRLGL